MTVVLGPILLLLIREFLQTDSIMEENSVDEKDDAREAKLKTHKQV